MTKQEMIKALCESKVTPFDANDAAKLEAFSEDQLKVLVAAAEPGEDDDDDDDDDDENPELEALSAQVTALTSQLKSLTEKKEATEEEYLKNAPESIRALVARQKAIDTERKTASIKALTEAKAPFSKDELEAKSADELEKLVTLAGKTVIDHGANGANGSALGDPDSEIPKARSLTQEIRDAHLVKTGQKQASA